MMVEALPPCRLSKWLQRFGVMVRMKLAWAGSARDAVWPWLAAVAAVAGLAESKRTFVRIDQPWFHRLAWAFYLLVVMVQTQTYTRGCLLTLVWAPSRSRRLAYMYTSSSNSVRDLDGRPSIV